MLQTMNRTSAPIETQDAARADEDRLLVRLGGHSRAGAKERNEDAFAAFAPEDDLTLRERGVAACVADGLSNAPRAREASQLATDQFIDDYFTSSPTWTAQEAISRSLTALNSWLYSQGRTASGAMATTFTGLVIRGRTAHLCQIGDSSAWLYRNGALERLTRAHSLSLSGGESVLTAALGAEAFLSASFESKALETGDMLILMTDGVSDAMPEAALRDWFAAQVTGRDLEQTSRSLCDEAAKRGAGDNLTVLCLAVDALPGATPGERGAALAARAFLPPLDPGHRVDGYVVERVLHHGVRSAVYRVRREADGEFRVLKAPTARFADDPDFIEALAREEWLGQKIGGERIVRTFPATGSAFIYLLTEHVPGQTLRQWMRDNPQPELSVAREMLHEIVQAVRAMHRQQVVHRDLKPENMMVTPEGRVKIIDFGSASIAGLNEISRRAAEWRGEGSVNYSAPEYILGDPATQASDLYSVACIIYELLCGELPYPKDLAANRIPDRLSAWRYIPISRRRDGLPDYVDAALEAALRADPAQRTPAFSEFEADMTRPGALALSRAQSVALLERDPLRFWQLLCAVQFAAIILLYFLS